MHDADHMMMPKPEVILMQQRERSRVHSEVSQTPEILGDTRTTNTRHR